MSVTRSQLQAIALKEIADSPMQLSVHQWRSIERLLVRAMTTALAEAGDEVVEPRRAGESGTTTDLVWLALAEGTAIGVERSLALSLDRRGFFDLYRKHVWGTDDKTAWDWADRQLEVGSAAYREIQLETA